MKAVPLATTPHRPVLYQETIEYMAPKSPGLYLDCTAGAGGHSEGILQASSPKGLLLALDLDPLAISLTKADWLPLANARPSYRHLISSGENLATNRMECAGWHSHGSGSLLDAA